MSKSAVILATLLALILAMLIWATDQPTDSGPNDGSTPVVDVGTPGVLIGLDGLSGADERVQSIATADDASGPTHEPIENDDGRVRLTGTVRWRGDAPAVGVIVEIVESSTVAGFSRSLRGPLSGSKPSHETDAAGTFVARLEPSRPYTLRFNSDILALPVERVVDLGSKDTAEAFTLDRPCTLFVHGVDEVSVTHPAGRIVVTESSRGDFIDSVGLSDWTGEIGGLPIQRAVDLTLHVPGFSAAALAQRVAITRPYQEVTVVIPPLIAETPATGWSFQWRVADPRGDTIKTSRLFNAGLALPHRGLAATMVALDGTSEDRIIDVGVQECAGRATTTLQPPITFSLSLGGIELSRHYVMPDDDIELVVSEPLVPGASRVLFHTVGAEQASLLIVSDPQRRNALPLASTSRTEYEFVGPPGHYGYYAVSTKGITAAGTFEIESQVDLSVPIEFDEPATVMGTVLPKAAAGEIISVQLMHDSLLGLIPGSEQSVDADGVFEFNSLAVGDYRVTVKRLSEGVTHLSHAKLALKAGMNHCEILSTPDEGGATVRITLPSGRKGLARLRSRESGDITHLRLAPSIVVSLAPGRYEYLVWVSDPRRGPPAPPLEGSFDSGSQPEVLIEVDNS